MCFIAFKALGRGRWVQFAQWANVWDSLNHVNNRVPSPFRALRDYANIRKEVISDEANQDRTGDLLPV